MSYGKTKRPVYWTFFEGQLRTEINGEMILADWIEGTITDIHFKDDEYQGVKYKKICIVMTDQKEDDVYELQIRLGSGYGIAFCMLFPSILFAVPVHISGSYQEKDGKKKTVLFVSQNGKSLKWYFTKDNPRDLPKLQKYNLKGREIWGSSVQQDFFIKMIESAVELWHDPVKKKEEKKLVEIPDASEITAPIDDLPF